MRRFIVFGMILVFVLAACGGGGASTASPASGTGASDEANGNAPVTNDSATADNPQSGPSNSNGDSNTAIAPNSGGGTNSNDGSGLAASSGSLSSSGGCTLDSASFVSDVTVEDNTPFQPGQTFTKTWLVKNNGNCTWTDLYHFVFAKGDQMEAPDSTPLQEIIPGNTIEISVAMKAPNEEDVTRARADFEIRNADGTAIAIDGGKTLWVIIRVANGEAPKGNTDNTSAGPGYADAACKYTTDAARVGQLFAELNAYRARFGIAPYAYNDQIAEAAQAHAADMACNKLFYHNGSNGSTATSRVAASGYLASYVTENVYGSWPPLSPAETIQWWANDASDPRHNENLLSTRFVEVGIGYAFFNNFGYYVIDFAVPQ